METSLLLAKIMGSYLFIAGIMCALRYNFFRQVVNDYFDSPALVLMGGAINIILGLLVINVHNVWEINWKIVITLMGYLMFMKGILHWFFQDIASSMASKVSQGSFYLYASIVMVMLGIYLAYIGYST